MVTHASTECVTTAKDQKQPVLMAHWWKALLLHGYLLDGIWWHHVILGRERTGREERHSKFLRCVGFLWGAQGVSMTLIHFILQKSEISVWAPMSHWNLYLALWLTLIQSINDLSRSFSFDLLCRSNFTGSAISFECKVQYLGCRRHSCNLSFSTMLAETSECRSDITQPSELSFLQTKCCCPWVSNAKKNHWI